MPELKKFVTTIKLQDKYLERLRNEFPDIEFVVCDRSDLPNNLPGAQAFMGGGLNSELFGSCADLKWAKSPGAGVDNFLFPELIESDVVVTNYSGAHAPNIAEHLIGMIIVFARRFMDAWQLHQQRRWEELEEGVFELTGQTLAIIGLGDIGQALATRAQCLGMRVTGSRRRTDIPVEGVDKLYSPDQLHEMIAEADHLAITVPLTRETDGLIGAEELRLMKPTAYIYNIGRGEIIDQDAMIAALKNGELAGAGLDVATPEPLPTDSPLWDTPNVFITPHYSGLSPLRWERGIELLVENIRRFQNDEPMLNMVDKQAGY